MMKWMIFIKTIKPLKKSGLTTENDAREQKDGFLSILLDSLGTSLLGNFLTGYRVKW